MATFLTCTDLIAGYKLDADGWDALNSRLTDFSGHGNHMSISGAASPTYVTKDGFSCIDFLNTYYFQGELALPSFFSCVFVGVVKAPGAEGILNVWTNSQNKTVTDNHDDSIELSDSEFLNTTYLRKALRINNNLPQLFDPQLGISGAGWTNDAMNMVTAVLTREPHGMKVATGTDDPTSGEFGSSNASAISYNGQFMRIGQLKATLGALTAGNYVAGKRLYFLRGDVIDHADYATMRAAEITAWGI